MKLQNYNYKLRQVCPECFSLAIKITSKKDKKYKCYTCGNTFRHIFKVELKHKGKRCIDNDIDSRKERYNKLLGRVI